MQIYGFALIFFSVFIKRFFSVTYVIVTVNMTQTHSDTHAYACIAYLCTGERDTVKRLKVLITFTHIIIVIMIIY